MDKDLSETLNVNCDDHDMLGDKEGYADDLMAISRLSAAVSGLSDLDAILRIGLENVVRIMNGIAGA
ncbi:hypothetical protein ACFLVP_00170 [Chloroflexota bacterium]